MVNISSQQGAEQSSVPAIPHSSSTTGHDQCLCWFAGQSSTSTTGAKKRAAPKGAKKDPDLDSDVSKKPNPPKPKGRRKRKPSTSDDSDSNFEKMISKAVTSKVFILVSPFAVDVLKHMTKLCS